MSRSFKKTPILGRTKCETEKKDKRKANRLFRRISKIAVQTNVSIPHHVKEVADVWKFGKDGKKYSTNAKRIRK